MFIDEISNIKLRKMVQAGVLDDTNGVPSVFKHRYSGGNTDWGYVDADGYYHAWFGGPETVDYDSNEDAADALEIIGGEIWVSNIDRSHRIGIECDHAEAEQFRDWLIDQGHDAWISTSTGNSVDGRNTSHDEYANAVMTDLWERYCNRG